MSKSEAKKCPECGNKMTRGILSVEGYVSWRINWRKKEFKIGKGIVAYRCQECGYVQLFSKIPPPQTITRACLNCGRVITGEAEFCPDCGKELKKTK